MLELRLFVLQFLYADPECMVLGDKLFRTVVFILRYHYEPPVVDRVIFEFIGV
jgi:hypothetical protein